MLDAAAEVVTVIARGERRSKGCEDSEEEVAAAENRKAGPSPRAAVPTCVDVGYYRASPPL